ncbi:tol-pal system YbgF family protein [Anaeromyxobacter sp. PSR-1]|uniref:tetratricopeptide repeat protein n=1 Tax=Anaeromyxobacter sp. PSR-1 TaxID=1300915 RepID=UPI0005DE0FC7|nr:tetratricopeptide repeat protein [Anaeromyxobacter sp. PSR-1]GAO03265.1 hypothetical protein PSR1_02148 [Anaeromyxobacter sp. PSR-1]
MSKDTVITRKDMKEPDKFQVAATQAASWAASRKKHLVIAGGAVVAVLVIVAAVSALRAQREQAAGAAASALLAAIGGEVSSVPLPGVPGPFFPTQEAKQRAIIAEAEKVLAAHAGTGPALMAELARGDAQYKLGEWDAALASYERYLKDAPADDSFRFGALEGVGLVREAKGDLAGAAQAYERLAAEAPKMADRADLERARVLAAAGKASEARALLAGFAEKHKDSLLTPEASERLARLGGKE